MVSSRVCPNCGRPVSLYWCSYCDTDLSPGGHRGPPRKIIDPNEGVTKFTELGECGGIPERGGIHKEHNKYIKAIGDTIDVVRDILNVIYIAAGRRWKYFSDDDRKRLNGALQEINKITDEYSKEEYILSGYQGGKYVSIGRPGRAIEYQREKMHDLWKIASDMWIIVSKLDDMAVEQRAIAMAAYKFLTFIGKRGVETRIGRWKTPDGNVFNDVDVREKYEEMRDTIKKSKEGSYADDNKR